MYSYVLGAIFFIAYIQHSFAEQFLLLDPKQYNFMSYGNVHVPNMDEKQEFKNTLVSFSFLKLVVNVSPKFNFLMAWYFWPCNEEIVSTNLTSLYLYTLFFLFRTFFY